MAGRKPRESEVVERRMSDLGRSTPTPDLAKLRMLCIQATNMLARSIWPACVLDSIPLFKQLDQDMLKTQATLKGTLNSVWAEKCRRNAREAVLEQRKRALRCLFGKFKNIGAVGDKPLDDGTRRLLNIPEAWSRKLQDADVSTLQGLAESMNFQGVIELFRKLRADHATSLPPLHVQALLAMLDLIEERWSCPEWSVNGTFMLHLDYRCYAGGRNTQDKLLTALSDAIAPAVKNGARATIPLLVSGVVARSAPIALKATLIPKVVQGLFKGQAEGAEPMRYTSLALELGQREVVVRGVLTQRPVPYALSESTHVLGDDFGYTNTSTMVVVQADRSLDTAFFETVKEWGKKEAKAYLSSHHHDGEAIEVEQHCGRDFMAAVERHALHVDALRGDIDRVYNRIHRIKHEVCRILGIGTDTRLDFGAHDISPETSADAGGDKRLARLLQKLQRLLKHVGHLKSLRRGVYRSVDGLKKSWFGWLANRKAALARRYHAVVVREDLSIVAAEKGSPEYKGRTFNKMLNNDSKGQYLRAAASKLRWHGIPEAVIPSSYTSTTDVRHGLVDARQRKQQDEFVARVDGRRMHADVHAALTIALYPLLRLFVPSMNSESTV